MTEKTDQRDVEDITWKKVDAKKEKGTLGNARFSSFLSIPISVR